VPWMAEPGVRAGWSSWVVELGGRAGWPIWVGLPGLWPSGVLVARPPVRFGPQVGKVVNELVNYFLSNVTSF
jgi:hypothetical protein